MSNYPITEHENMVETLINQTRDLLSKIKNHECKKDGITIRQFAVLDIIDLIGDQTTPKEISNRLLRQPHTISSLLIRMEKDGLISRDINPNMKVSINVNLTKKGRQLLNKTKKRSKEFNVLSCLSDQEIQQLVLSLKKIRNEALDRLARINGPQFP